ncbi:MAG: hypothetical protein JXQ90_01030 [Cyclobacteriaceae bacterium]
MSTKVRVFVIIITIIMTLAVAVRYLLKDFTANLAGSILFELIDQKTKGQYQISQETISFYPISKMLILENFEMKGNNELDEDIYHIKIPSLQITVHSILDIYFNQSLKLNQVIFNAPEVLIVSSRKGKTQNVTLETSKLYQDITTSLDEFAVESFELKNGQLTIVQKTSMEEFFSIRNMDFMVHKFMLASDTTQEFIRSETIRLKVANEQFFLKDGSHEVLFDSLIYNSTHQSIGLFNLSIKPIRDSHQVFNIDIPELSIHGFDLSQTYYDQDLELDSIVISDSKTALKLDLARDEDHKKNPVANLVSDIISQFSVKDVKVKNGQLNGIWKTKAGDLIGVFDDIQLTTGLLEIDSMAIAEGLLQYLDQINLRVTQAFFQNQAIDSLTVRGLTIDNRNNTYGADHWFAEVSNDATDIRGHGNELLLNELNIDLLLDSGMLSAELIQLGAPNINIKALPRQGKKSIIKKLDALVIEDATLNFENDTIEIQIERLNAHLTKILATSKWSSILSSATFDATSTSFNISNHTGSLDKLVYSPLDNIYAVNHLTFEQHFVEDLLLYGLAHYVLPQSILFDSILTNNVRSIVQLGRRKVKLPDLQFKNINMVNNDLLIINGKDSVSINGDLLSLTYDSIHGMLLSSARNIKGIISTPTMRLNIDTIDYDRNNGIELKNYNVHVKRDSLNGSVEGDHLAIPNYQIELQREMTMPEKVVLRNAQIDLEIIPSGNNELTQLPSLILDNSDYEILIKGKDSIRLKGKIDNLNTKGDQHKDIIQYLLSGTFQVQDVIVNSSFELTVSRLNHKSEFNSIQIDSISILDDNLTIKIPIVGLNYKSLDIGKRSFLFDTINLVHPNVDLQHLSGTSDSSDLTLEAGYFHINDGSFSLIVEGLANGQFDHINVKAEALQWKPNLTLQQLLNESNMSVSFGPYAMSLSGQYESQWDKLSFDTKSATLSLSNIEFNAKLDKEDFMAQSDYQIIWPDVSLDELIIEEMDLSRLIESQHFSANRIVLSSPNAYLYKDKRLPERPIELMKLPHVLLQESNQIINVRQVDIENGRIVYVQQNDNFLYPGRIMINDVNGHLLNVTNDSLSLLRESEMLLEASARVYNAGQLNIDGTYHLDDTAGGFVMNGLLDEMDLTQLNHMMEHITPVTITSGRNKTLNFGFRANNQYAVGNMKFYYDDLKISVKNQATDDTKVSHAAAFKSFFANTFVVNKRNPRLLFVRRGDIFTQRIQHKSIFNYWANALLSGAVSSIGARNNKKEIRQLNKENEDSLTQ